MAPVQGILGQTHALDQLHAQLASGRVHHAHVFHGPPGVGKFTTALAFARVLLCHERQTGLTGEVAACGRCPSCLMFNSPASHADGVPDEPQGGMLTFSHPDLHVVNKELALYSDDAATRGRKLLSIPVEVLKQHLLGPAHRAAQLGRGKVFIVDEAELLNPTGQNALLKTLEEPPNSAGGGTTIILVTSQEERLLPTIRSRCQRTAFGPLPDDVMYRYLERHAGDLAPVERDWLAGFAAGSLGRAGLVLDYDLVEWARVIVPALDRLADGRPAPSLGGDMADRVEAFAQAWVKAHDNASKEAANRTAAGLMFAVVAGRARHRIATLAEGLDPADPFAAEATLDPWLHAIEALRTAEARLYSNVNLGLVFDGLAADLALALRHHAAAV